jgi:transposase
MVHVHGRRAQQLAVATRGLEPSGLIAVPIDVGKRHAVALVCDFTGELLARPFRFAINRAGIAELIGRVAVATAGRPVGLVRVGIEAAGHYHRPLLGPEVFPAGWQLVQVNPAQVAAQRQVAGRRGVKTDPLDLVAISDLLRAGHGAEYAQPDPVVAELAAWVAHRQRRVEARTALKNQLLGQVDRIFPGVTGCIRRPLGSKVGRLILAEFTDPGRLAGLDPAQVRAEAAAHGVQLHPAMAHCLVSTARVALTCEPVAAARVVLAQDLEVLKVLEAQVTAAEQHLAALVERTRFAVLTTTPGWSAVRAASYAAAVGDLARWPSHRQIYRAAGLPPVVYASAGRRRDGPISREGSVQLRRALLGLGVGLWRHDPPARAWAAQLRARGKAKGVIATALANRACRIAFAMVRDQKAYQPDRWR